MPFEVVPNQKSWTDNALVSSEKLNREKAFACEDSDQFWAGQAEQLVWRKKWSQVSQWSFKKPVGIQWFLNGKLNITESCLDRHVETAPQATAFRWVPEDESKDTLHISYQELLEKTCQLANGLKELGIRKGDRVTIYMPMIPEALYSVLACARIGAVHSIVFAGFSANSIADRIEDCDSQWLITADEGLRGGKSIPLKSTVDQALQKTDKIKKVLMVKRTGAKVPWNDNRDVDYESLVSKQSTLCPAELMDSEDPLFILYTSGSTGKPKGVLHTCGGYGVYASYTHRLVFNYRPGQIYWCAADIGWITGHSYIVYGPLINGAESIFYEGLPTCPDAGRIWRIVEKEKVEILYTAPTLIRALMREGSKHLGPSRSSLKLLGSVGEPINPEAWRWYFEEVGGRNCPIVDTWWQTETGGIMISPIPGTCDLKPGSATQSLPGIETCILSDEGKELPPGQTGHLCIKSSWPGQMRTVFGDHSRFEETYFSQFPGYYYAGDECHIDKDGDHWIIGRADDVINVSGHRLGTAEIESALVAHKAVAESAVVGIPHELKGQAIYAFVCLNADVEPSESLAEELIQFVREDIGAIAKPEAIQFAEALPKTRSGKIMRRILRKIASGDQENLGDTTTLADPSVIEKLIKNSATI